MASVPVQPVKEILAVYSSKDLEVIVDFGKAIPPDLQGKVLLQMERSLRESGVAACVFKRTMPDDSKLRLRMTDEERAKL